MRNKQLEKRIARDRQRLKKIHYKAYDDAIDVKPPPAAPKDVEEHGAIPREVFEAEPKSERSKPDGSQ